LICLDVYCFVRDDELGAMIKEQMIVETDDNEEIVNG
jgi:hypothetical protein